MIPKTLQSSADDKKYSLTLQSAIALIIISLLPTLNIDLSAGEVTQTIETIGVVLAGLGFLAGIFRKLYIGLGIGK